MFLFNTSQFIYLKYLITLISHVTLPNTKVHVFSFDKSLSTLNICHITRKKSEILYDLFSQRVLRYFVFYTNLKIAVYGKSLFYFIFLKKKEKKKEQRDVTISPLSTYSDWNLIQFSSQHSTLRFKPVHEKPWLLKNVSCFHFLIFNIFVLQVLAVVNVVEWLPKEHLELFENKIRHLDKHIKVNTNF